MNARYVVLVSFLLTRGGSRAGSQRGMALVSFGSCAVLVQYHTAVKLPQLCRWLRPHRSQVVCSAVICSSLFFLIPFFFELPKKKKHSTAVGQCTIHCTYETEFKTLREAYQQQYKMKQIDVIYVLKSYRPIKTLSITRTHTVAPRVCCDKKKLILYE